MLTTLELIWWVLQKISCPNKKMGGLDIHTTKYANSPLIGKLVWHMLQASCKFWVNIPSKKYVSNAVFFCIQEILPKQRMCLRMVLFGKLVVIHRPSSLV